MTSSGTKEQRIFQASKAVLVKEGYEARSLP